MAITYTDNGGGAANGSDKEFTYTFPVIQTEDVKVALNGVTQATTKYTVDNVSNPTKITFNTTNPTSGLQVTSGTNQGAPLAGVRVRVYRETTVGKTNGDESPKAVFAAGSSIRAIDLNANQEQSLMAIHELQDRPIETEDIQNDAITNVKIADDQIDSEHYVAGSIDLEHMSANSVDSDQYVDGSIDHIHLSNDCVDGDNIQDDSINSEHYVDRSIDTQHIGGSQVTTNELANNSVTTIKITDLNVTRGKLEPDAVDGTKLADNACDSEHYTDGSIDHVHLSNDCIDGDNIQNDVVNSEHIAAGALDNEHYADGSITSDKLNAATVITSSEQGSATTNDTSFLTSAAADARFFNISSGDTIKDGQSFPDNDTTIATTAAINDRIIDIVNDVGGFDIIESEQHFPNTNPQGQAGSAAVLSIKAATGNLVPSGTTLTISNGNLANNANITITGVTSTIPTGFGFIVESTSTLHTYTFHRLVPKATEVTTVAGISSNVTTVAGVASNVTTVAGISSNVTAVAGNASNINAVAGNASNINAVAADASDIGIVAADGTDIGLVAGSITNVNNVGGSIANVNTVASNLSGVNSFADRYRVDSSAPGTNNDAGDLYFDTSSNELRVYNGSAWQGGVTATGNLAGTGANTFTGNQTIQNSAPSLAFIDTDSNSDFSIFGSQGEFRIRDQSNTTNRITIASDGTTTIDGNLDCSSGVDVTGNITVSGNVDGRDIAADGSSLDNIEAGNIGTDVTNGNIKLSPNGTGVVEVRGAGGADGTLQLNCSAQSHGIKLKSPPHSAAQSYTLTFPSSIVNNGFLKTDSSGNLSFAAVNTDLVNDTSPQLGGNLDTNDKNIVFGDSDGGYGTDNRAVFGAGSDLKIYHNGSHSYIEESGTGNLYIRSSNTRIQSSTGEDQVLMTEDGAVELYYDNSKKFETTSAGVTVTGDLTGTAHINLGNNKALRVGSTNQMQFFHDGNAVILGGSGDIYQKSAGSMYLRTAGDENAIAMTANGAVELYHDNSKKFDTTSTGARVTGRLTTDGVHIGDGGNNDTSLSIGASNDLRLYHDGSNSYILDRGTGSLAIAGSVVNINSSDNNEYQVRAIENAQVELYYNGVKKLYTYVDGAKVEGDFVFKKADGTTKASWSGVENRIKVNDGTKFIAGDGNDLQIYHDGSNGNSHIKESGSGSLVINADDLYLQNAAGTENLAIFKEDGAVELYYDNSKKFETFTWGTQIYGTLGATNHIDIGNDTGRFKCGASADLQLYHSGSHSYLKHNGTGNLYVDVGSDDLFAITMAESEHLANFTGNGAVELFYDGSKKVETTSSGINVTGAITVNGSALGSGGLKQTKFTSINETSGETSFSTSYVEMLSLDITPSDSSNKVVVFSAVMQYIANTSGNLYALPQAFRKLTRTVSGTETTLIEDSVLSQRDNYNGTKYQEGMSSLAFQDSPNTTNQVTYKIYFKRNSNTNSANVGHGMMTLMETAV